MSWRISRKGDQYRVWSTVSDQWLTDWISRKEAIAFYYEDTLLQFKKKVIQQYLSFPHHWPDHDGSGYRSIFVDEEANEKYCNWLHDLLDKPDEEYEQFVNETFSNVLKECEVSYPEAHDASEVKDEDGTC